MQTIKLDLSNSDFSFFCPVTGKRIVGPECFEPSAATVFTYLDEIGEFEHLSDELKKVAEALEDADVDMFDFFESFSQQIKSDSVVSFEITTHGMACGPVSSTVRIGIDMDYRDRDEQ